MITQPMALILRKTLIRVNNKFQTILYQLLQVIDGGGYSNCGNDNQNLAEQLSHNLLYHLYQENSGKGDSRNANYEAWQPMSKELKTIG